jgi:hypothetical protein
MELNEQQLALVRDALFNRDMKATGSFIFNKAAEKLEEHGTSTLPAIEHVLLHEVMPQCDRVLNYVPMPFAGASNVLLTYFRLCKENDLLPDAVRFLRSLQGTLRVEALRVIKIVWLSRKPANGIPAPLMDVINEVASTGADLERQVAQFVIEAQKQKDEEPEDFRDALFNHLRSGSAPKEGNEKEKGTA